MAIVENFEVERVRKDFPLIQRAGAGQASCGLHAVPENEGLIYFDSAATMQRPEEVIQAVRRWQTAENANPLRGMYDLSTRATEKLAEARRMVTKFIGAKSEKEVFFTSGATMGLNLVAWMMMNYLSSDDEVLVESSAHSSNLLPWMELHRRMGVGIRTIQDIKTGATTEEDLAKLLTPNTRIVALSAMSNVTGAKPEVKKLVEMAHKVGALVVIDAAQAVAHERIRVRDWDADIVVWSGHKIGAPMGVGVVYGKIKLLKGLTPIIMGGGMMEETGFSMKMAEAPQRFEAGTLNMDGIVGLMAAIGYWERIGWKASCEYVRTLTDYAREKMEPLVKILGAENGVISFNVPEIHAHDTAEILAGEGIAVRAGYHCAQLFLELNDWGPVVRVSLAPYNTEAEVDKMVEVLATVRERMGYEKRV